MVSGVWSEIEPSAAIETVDDLDRFVEFADANSERPTAISIEVHGYRVDLLVGHDESFLHLAPEDPDRCPYYVTVGGTAEGVVDFWLHAWHHTQFESRHLIPKTLAREAFREFFRTGKLSSAVEWEQYTA
jgi:hypothetical protein